MEVLMAGVNKAILIGNLGRDPEIRRTPSGQSVASFTLATTERRTDKNGQKQDKTEWHNIVAWAKLADLCGQYLKKGRTIYVEGRITNRSWDDKDGNKKYRSEIVASTISF
jgi:single-strand DNA-binding protein